MEERRVALVTGAAHGLGAAYAEGLSRRGFRLALIDVADLGATLGRMQTEARAYRADMTAAHEVEQAVAAIKKDFGRIDVLVNNVGGFPSRPFTETHPEFWQQMIRLNLDSAYLGCYYVVPGMIEQRYGRIINIASGTVFKGNAEMSAYVAAKMGVIGLTRVLATELGPYGITVNCIAPGLTDTPGARQYTDGLKGEEANIARRAIPRRETPEDVVGAVLFFASDDASFITGQTLVVDGGNVRH
ncbi:MAG: SDR family oxidoreductase [Firmicutes bacterium]|nr:SDR family oxidoreductase [Bacillota bacterium]